MARSDLLKDLLRSYQRGDDRAFRSAADAIVEDERKKRHEILADELEAIINGAPPRRARPANISSLRPLPKAREDVPLLDTWQSATSFQDVVLRSETEELVLDLVDEFRQRTALAAHGLRPRTAVLFLGPPGCGKSVTAEAVAGELGLGIARIRLAAVVSSYLGETARNLEQVFSFIKTGAWVLLFDEFDMLATERSSRPDHGEVRRIVTALLQLVEDTQPDSLVIATTNHPHLLDSAIWRRFDEIVEFRLPDNVERMALIELNLRAVKHDIDIEETADRVEGHSHAQVEQVCLDAIRLMVRRHDRVVGSEHFEYAIARQEERRRTIQHSQESETPTDD